MSLYMYSYPLIFVGARDGVLDLFKVSSDKRTTGTLNKVTVGLMGVVTLLAAKLTDLGLVASVGGATFGTALVFCYPCIMFMRLRPPFRSTSRSVKAGTATSPSTCTSSSATSTAPRAGGRRGGGGRVLLRTARPTRRSSRTARSATLRADGVLTVWSSTPRSPTTCTASWRASSSCRPAQVRVIQPAVGGAFGGKTDPFASSSASAKLGLVTGRPVKILYTREEVFYAHRGRHPMRDALPRRGHAGRAAHRRRREDPETAGPTPRSAW